MRKKGKKKGRKGGKEEISHPAMRTGFENYGPVIWNYGTTI